MIGDQANSLVSLLRSLSALQKTLRVIGFINCSDNDNETVSLNEFINPFRSCCFIPALTTSVTSSD